MDYGLWAAGVPGESDVYIPVYRGFPITAEASLSRQFIERSPSLRSQLGTRTDSPDFSIVQRRVTVRPLDDLALNPAFVKVDVQGHEQPALKGTAHTLDKFGPPVLVESPSPETEAFMSSLGYKAHGYDHTAARLVRPTGAETNVLFGRSLPAVRVPASSRRAHDIARALSVNVRAAEYTYETSCVNPRAG